MHLTPLNHQDSIDLCNGNVRPKDIPSSPEPWVNSSAALLLNVLVEIISLEYAGRKVLNVPGVDTGRHGKLGCVGSDAVSATRTYGSLQEQSCKTATFRSVTGSGQFIL